jgi:hypothetical protein
MSTMVAVLPSIGAGTAMAFTSTAASQYRTPNATSLVEPLTDDESSWFGRINLKGLFAHFNFIQFFWKIPKILIRC